MDRKQIIKTNKAICDYMGWPAVETHPNGTKSYDVSEAGMKIPEFFDDGVKKAYPHEVHEIELEFERDWNALVRVLIKIRSRGFKVTVMPKEHLTEQELRDNVYKTISDFIEQVNV